MNRKCFILSSVLATVFLLLACVLPLSFGSRSVPPFATVEAIEANYDLQINRLLQLADKQLAARVDFNDPADMVLFGAQEILEAKVEPSNHLIGSKAYKFTSRFSVVPGQASLDASVVNRHWDTHADGSKMTVLEYRRHANDDEGREVRVVLLFDLSALEKRVADRASTDRASGSGGSDGF